MAVPRDDARPPELSLDPEAGVPVELGELPVGLVGVEDEFWPPRLPGRTPIRRSLLRRLRGYPTAASLVKRGLTLGRDVYIGEVYLDYGFLWLIAIGDGAVLTHGVRILAHDASTKHWTGYTRIGRVEIGRRAYIGAGTIVLPDVRVGDDSIVGAGSVVTRDVPARTVAAGNPARPIASLEEFVARHRQWMAHRPRYPRAGFAAYDSDVSPANMARMRRELRDGPGYIQ
jgi:maltose O-acetyltransferase